MVAQSGPLDERGADLRFEKMFDLARQLPCAEQPILIRGTDEIIGYVGVAVFNLTSNELESFDTSEQPDLAGAKLELNCHLVEKARGFGIGPCSSWEVLKVWKTTSGGEVFARPNRRSKKIVEDLGFRNIKRIDSWELWRLVPKRLVKPSVCGY